LSKALSSEYTQYFQASAEPAERKMPTANTILTPARFAQGLSYSAFLEQALVNRDKFDQYYRTSPLSEEDLSFFRKAAAAPHGLANILALAEAWCGDVYRELPTVARIADATGVNLRIFLRDENPDIMNEFLSNGGKARAIPVFVFYTSDMRYIARFVERPASAQAEIDVILSEVAARLKLPAGATFTNLPEEGRQEVIARILPRFSEWQKDSIKEMRELLSTVLNLPAN
jgi:Thioredoxin